MKKQSRSYKFHTFSHPTPRINKHLLAIFLLTLFGASFLASCTDGPTGNANARNLNLNNCPADQLEIFTDVTTGMVTVDWVNPTGTDFTITSIGIAHTDSTITDPLPTLDTNSTSATLPEGTYTVSITTANTADPSVTNTCEFTIMVSSPAFTSICQESIDISLTSAGSITFTATNTSVTARNANREDVPVTWEFVPPSVTDTDVDRTVSVTATATDDNGNMSTCNFDVTVNPAGTPEFANCRTDSLEGTVSSGDTVRVSWTAPIASVPDDFTAVITPTLAVAESSDFSFPTGTSATGTFDRSIDSDATSHEFPVGVFTVTYRATNANAPGSRSVSCAFTVNVKPAITLTCESTTASPMATMGGTTPVQWSATPTVTGLNNDPTITITSVAMTADTDITVPTIDDNATMANFPIGRFTVMATAAYTLTDGVIATGDCSFMVIVEDTALPQGQLLFLDSDINSDVLSDNPGTSTNPFLIRNANDLNKFAIAVNTNSNIMIGSTMVNYRTAAYRLENDITLTTSGMENNFTPIGIGRDETVVVNQLVITCNNTCFQGTFDGSNNTISGLYFSNDSQTNLGLFGVISGNNTSISNLNLSKITIEGRLNIGGLVGVMLANSSLNNVSVSTGTVKAGTTAGGLVGRMSNSSITNAFSSVPVTGNNLLGGITGIMVTSGITNAYASGTVDTARNSGLYIGGLVGAFSNESSLINTLARGKVGEVAGSPSNGGLLGISTGNNTITSSYGLTNARGLPSKACGIIDKPCPANAGQSAAALRIPTNAGTTMNDLYYQWDSSIWNFGGMTDYPVISVTNFPISVDCQRDPSSDTDCPNYIAPTQ